MYPLKTIVDASFTSVKTNADASFSLYPLKTTVDASFTSFKNNADTSLNLKANLNSPTFTGTLTTPSAFITTLNSSGDSSFNGNVTIDKDLLIKGRLNVQQYQNQNIINTTTTNYQLIVSEDLSLNGRLFASGDVLLNGNLNVIGITTIQTPSTSDNSTKAATTAFVKNQGYSTITGIETLTNKTLTAPTLTTPTLGVATATSINGMNITTTTGTLTLANGTTFSTAGNFIQSGAFATTLTSTAATNVTLPTSGTLATLAGTETLANKTLTTPNIGAATATSINNVVITSRTGTLSLANSSTFSTTGAFVTTLNSSADSTVNLPTTGTLATLAGNETFTNKTLTAPTLTTPTLGVATATSVNKITFTQPTNNATLTLGDQNTVTTSGNVSLIGSSTTAVSVSLPSAAGTLALLASPTFTGTLTTPTANITTLNAIGDAVFSGNISIAGRSTSTVFTTASDYRIKANIQSLIDTSFNVDLLKPVTYINKKLNIQDIGFIAHEVQEQIPFLVTGEKDGEEFQSLNYTAIIGILTKEIQELKREMKEVRTELALLKK